jgi:maltose O-acetyltransferase
MALNSYFGEIHGVPVIVCPLLIQNSGKISFGQACQFGYHLSSSFFSSYVQLNVRSQTGSIIIGDQSIINNGAVIVSEFSEGAGITIGKRNLIGVNFKCFDSDFHGANKNKRNEVLRMPVSIGDDCFFGDNVTVLKGVNVGSGVTIAYGSTVVKNVPDNVLVSGTPAKIIRELT